MKRLRWLATWMGMAFAVFSVPRPLSAQETPLVARSADAQAPVQSAVLQQRAQIELHAVTPAEALAALRDRTDVRMLFSPSILPDESISCVCADLTVAQALDRILAGTGSSTTFWAGRFSSNGSRRTARAARRASARARSPDGSWMAGPGAL